MSVSAVSSSSTTTNYPILVNGILCYSAAEVTAAKSYQDLHAEKQAETSTVSQSEVSQRYPVTVNGQLCFSAADVTAARNYTSENKPQTSGTRGTVIDMYA